MPDATRKDLIKQLLAEQNYLCAYCSCSITEDTLKIEHWHARNQYPAETLDYANLFAVCQGNLYCGNNRHCDRSREENTSLILKPSRKDHIDQISFARGTGVMSSENEELQFDLNSPKRLNLNCPGLLAQRQEVLRAFRRALRARGKKPKYQRLLDNELRSRTGFNDIILHYLREKVRQKR